LHLVTAKASSHIYYPGICQRKLSPL
jgi:hypothetical protein